MAFWAGSVRSITFVRTSARHRRGRAEREERSCERLYAARKQCRLVRPDNWAILVIRFNVASSQVNPGAAAAKETSGSKQPLTANALRFVRLLRKDQSTML